MTNDQKAAGSYEFLSVVPLVKKPVFQYATTDGEGNFSFNIHIDEALKDLIILPDDHYQKLQNNYRIIIFRSIPSV